MIRYFFTMRCTLRTESPSFGSARLSCIASAISTIGATLGDIKLRTPSDALRGPAATSRLDALVASFEALADRSRRQSLSMLVPMGQEMAYRYQEGVIHETLAVLRDFRRRAAPTTPE